MDPSVWRWGVNTEVRGIRTSIQPEGQGFLQSRESLKMYRKAQTQLYRQLWFSCAFRRSESKASNWTTGCFNCCVLKSGLFCVSALIAGVCSASCLCLSHLEGQARRGLGSCNLWDSSTERKGTRAECSCILSSRSQVGVQASRRWWCPGADTTPLALLFSAALSAHP